MRRSLVYSALALALALGYSGDLFASSHREAPNGARGCSTSHSTTPVAPVQVKRADFKAQPAAR